jgi:hypothetical protein
MPLLLYFRGKSPRYPLDRRLGGPQSQSGRYGEEKILTLLGLELWPIGTRYTNCATLARLPYMEAISIMHNLRTLHALVLRDPLSMEY